MRNVTTPQLAATHWLLQKRRRAGRPASVLFLSLQVDALFLPPRVKLRRGVWTRSCGATLLVLYRAQTISR